MIQRMDDWHLDVMDQEFIKFVVWTFINLDGLNNSEMIKNINCEN